MSSSAFRTSRVCVLAVLAVVVCLLAVPGRAEEKVVAGPRMAYVNMETVFQGYYETLRSNEALSKQKELFVQRANELAGQLDALKKARDENREKSLNIALTDEVRAQNRKDAEEKDLLARDKDRELREFVQGKDKELAMKHMELRNEIVKKLTEFIKTYAENHQFDLVVDVSGRTLNGISVMVYYPKDKEITDTVLTELNKGHESEISKAAETGKKEDPALAKPVKTPEIKPTPVEPAKPAPEPVKAPEVKPPEPAKIPEVIPVALPAEAAKPVVPKPAATPAPVANSVPPVKSSPTVDAEAVATAPLASTAAPANASAVAKPAAAPKVVAVAKPAATAKPATAAPAERSGGFWSFSWLAFWRTSKESAPPAPAVTAPVAKTVPPVKTSPTVHGEVVATAPVASTAAPANASAVAKPAAAPKVVAVAKPAATAKAATGAPAERSGGFWSFSWLAFWRTSKESAPPPALTPPEVKTIPAPDAAAVVQ